jgi:hypothetical protein
MRLTDSQGIGLLEVTDVSGQKGLEVNDVPSDATVGELVESLLAEMQLKREDTNGRPLTYHARLEREGRHLHASERVGDALQTGDKLVLQPNIDAGSGATPGYAER